MSTNKTFNKVQLDVKFTQASSRANLTSEENISISFGKLSKWYSSLVPTGGSSGQFLGWNSDGTAKWVSNPNVDTKVNVTLATTSKAYLLGTTTTPTGTATGVTSVADTGVYLGTSAGSLHASTFYGDLSGTATYADELNMKTLTADTLDTTPGSYVFKGNNLLGGINDWVGLQVDASNDRFQLAVNDQQLMFRQNDNAAITGSWSNWVGILTPPHVDGGSGITVTQKDIAIGSGDTAFRYKGGVTISHSNSITASSSTVFKKFSYDANGHITGTANVTASDIPSLNYVPNTQAGVNAAINLLSTGSSIPSLADYYVSQFASGGTSTTTYHRRPVSALWNAFKGLITLTTTGSGNAVTSVSIANDGDHNRKITVTKGSTFSLSTHNHDSDYVKTFLSTNYDINQPGYYAVMSNQNTENPDIDYELPTTNQWWHVLSMSYSGNSGDVTNWMSQLAIPTYQSKLRGLYWRTNSAANTELSADDWKRVYCEEKLTPSTTTKTRNVLNLWGNTVGNNASELISGTAGVLSYGDAGPQINFSTGATIGAYQDSAIIWTDHDTAASGASWHFVSSQSDWNVISKRFHARTGISIGTDLPQTSYNLYVNGTTFHSDNITFGSASSIVVGSIANIYTRTTSTYSTLAKWSNGNTWGTRGAEIGYHNTGGDSTNPGTICILPYQTETNPWDGQVGLFIKKDHVYIDGVELSKSGHTHSYIPMSGSMNVTGNIEITKASGDVGFYAKRSDTGVEVWMGVGSDGTNHGIYSNKLGKWMMYGNASNVYLNGNATTASSWENARTLTLGGQLTGSVSVKGDTNMTLSGYLKNTLIHDDTSDFASYAWHKFAEVDITAANSDQTITFIVSKTWGQVPGFSGILTAHVRVGSTKIYDSSQFQWNLAGTGIDPDDFVLVYTDTANTSCKVELWYKQIARYDGWIFTILKEHGRSNIHSVWTVYTDSGHGSATHTAGTGTVTSTIADIKNDTSVLQSNTATGNYRPVMFGTTNTSTIADLSATITGQAYVSTQMFAKPSIGYMYATCFSTTSYLDGTGAQLSPKGLYLRSVCEENSGTKYSYSRYAVRTYSGKLSSDDGMLLDICGGGLTIVGSGESATSLAALIDDDQTVESPARLDVGGTLNTSFTGSNEYLILSSDQSMYFLTNCNTVADRMPVVLDTDSYFYPGTTKTGSLGTSSYYWGSAYIDSLYLSKTSELNTASGNALYFATRTDTNVSISFGVGAGGVSHGIYSYKLGGWMVYGDASNVYVRTSLYNPSSTANLYALPLLGGEPSTGTHALYNNNGFRYSTLEGTTSALGLARLVLGNGTGSGTAGNKRGSLRLYSAGTNYIDLIPDTTDSSQTITIPATTGSMSVLRKALITDSSNDFASYAWHKFADATFTSANYDYIITFLATLGYGSVAKNIGLLTMHVRCDGNKILSTSSSQLEWTLATEEIDPNNFVLVYTNTSGTSCKIELWYKQSKRYDGYTFTIINENNRTNKETYSMNLYDEAGHGQANLPSGTGTIVSSLGRLKNAPGVYIVKGTQTASTSSWTGKIDVSELYDGLTIAYYLPYASTSTASTLNLTLSDGTTTGAINCYWNTSSRITTHYGAGSTILLTYWSAGSISISGAATTDNRWTRCDYNANNNVTQNISTGDGKRPLLMSYYQTGVTTTSAQVTYRNDSIYAIASTGSLYATKFYGNITSAALNDAIYQLYATSKSSTFNGTETLITSLPSSSGTATPSYQRITINGFIKKVINDLKEPVLYENTTNPTASATVSFNASLGTPKYLKLFIKVIGGSSYSSSSGVMNVVDIDPSQYSNGCFVGHGAPGSSGVPTYLTYICIIHSETSGQHTYSCVKAASLSLYTGNPPSTVPATVYITKVIAVY